MKTIFFLKITSFILLTSTVYSQTIKNISGTIYSNSTGHPIQGANIISKNTGEIFVSDNKGEFNCSELSDLDTLLITYIGYESLEIALSHLDQNSLNIRLNETIEAIEEVFVSTGYQTLPKERAAGSFTHINNELLNRSVSTDLLSRLEGITNGLLFEYPSTSEAPSSTPNLRIRGLSTIKGESDPLIVVDNFPYEGNINNINPNDVESITVLKDAAAASIWGARAGNGVIVINTKSGSVEHAPIINFNSNLTVIDKADLFYSRKMLPPDETVELERILFKRGLFSKNDWTAFTPAVEILFAEEEGVIDELTTNRLLEELKIYDVRSEASKYLYRQSLNQQYSINSNGGSEKYKYYFSSGLDKNKGHLIGNNNSRITISSKNDFRPNDNLHISSSVNFIKSQSINNGVSLFSITPSGLSSVYSYARLADEAGNPLPIIKNNRFTYTDNALELGLLDWHYRPMDEINTNENISSSQEIRINTSITYKILKGLNAEARYQYQDIEGKTKRHYSKESYFTRNLINQYTQADGSRPIPLGEILDKGGNSFLSHYGRIQLNYTNSWHKAHEISGLAGFEIRAETDKNHGLSRLYGYDDDILTYETNLNFDDNFPLRPRLSGRIPFGTSAGTEMFDRFVSYYANLSYSFDKRYIFTTSSRWDASNIFGVSFNQKGVPLWSIGTAWNMTNEPFFHSNLLSSAKLRITFGANGNAVRSISALPVISYLGAPNAITGLPYGRLQSVGNPDLKWEKVNIFNIGLDFSLSNNRVSGSFEWYGKNSTDLIGEDLFDPTTGIHFGGSSYSLDNRRNYANMRTKGIDFELNTINIKKKTLWETSFLFSVVKNRITNYHTRQNARPIDFLQAGTTAMPLVEGLPREPLYALPWNGLDATGSPLVEVSGELGDDYNTYFNVLTYEDLLNVGTTTPSLFGAIRNSFTWNSISFGFNIMWKAGYKFRRESINYNSLFGTNRIMHEDYIDRWQKAGDEHNTIVPSMPETNNLRRDQAYIFSEALIEKGNHIRLQDLNLSYELPSKLPNRIGLAQVNLYAYAKNLGILWKHTKYSIDPDVKSMYPSPFQISFGLQIKI